MGRIAQSLVRWWRLSPVTSAYLAILLVGYWIIRAVLSDEQMHSLVLASSTNVTNLEQRPVQVLVLSTLFIATPLLSIDTALTVGLGIAGCMAWIERRTGWRSAVVIFVAGHVGATLLTWPVINLAVDAGLYPPDVRDAPDVGVSYGSIALTTAVVRYLPGWAALLWVGGGVGYILSQATWSGLLPDFTTVGHLFGVAIGLVAVGIGLLRERRADSGPGAETADAAAATVGRTGRARPPDRSMPG